MSDTSGESTLAMTASPAAAGGGAVSAPPSARRARRPGRGDWRKWLEITVLAGPAIVVFTAFVLVPVVLAGYYGFFKWKGFGPPTHFVGLDNYVLILKDSAFHAALEHNGFILVMSLVIQGPVAIGLALLLNQKIRGRSLIRVLIFVPYVISEVIAATGFILMPATT